MMIAKDFNRPPQYEWLAFSSWRPDAAYWLSRCGAGWFLGLPALAKIRLVTAENNQTMRSFPQGRIGGTDPQREDGAIPACFGAVENRRRG